MFQKICKDLNVTVGSFNKDFVCSDCMYGKLRQSNFPISKPKASAPLELVFSDVWGPAPIVTSEGFKYYVHFLDDYTITWIFH